MREDLEIEPGHPGAKAALIAADRAIVGAAIDDCGQPKGLLADRMAKVRPGSNLGKTEQTSRHFSYIRCPVGRPAMTLQKSVSFGGITMWHPFEERNLSIGETKRIGGYPDSFAFAGKFEDAINRIGNSVPPLFMRAIALHVRGLLTV